MMFTSRMVHLTAIVMKNHGEAVARELLKVGVVHFNRLGEIVPSLGARLREASVADRRSALAETRQRIEVLLRLGGLPAPSAVFVETASDSADTDSIGSKLDRLARDVEQYRNRQAEIQQEIHRVGEVRRQLAALPSDTAGAVSKEISQRDHHSFLQFQFGRLPASEFPAADRELIRFSAILLEVADDRSDKMVLVVGMKRNSAEVATVLDRHGFRKGDLPKLPEDADHSALEQTDERLARLRSEQAEQEANVSAVIARQRDELERDWRRIRVVELLLSIRGTTSETEHATVFTGWVPLRQQSRVDAAIQAVTAGECCLEWHSADEMQDAGAAPPPVELQNPRILRPFQMLVTNYGIPEYGTIDPTPLVAIAYLLMFGLMFGDAGHGLVLVLLGLMGRRIVHTPTMQQLARLLMWCGGASIVTGVLFGAYFGFELLPPLWFDYHGVVAGHAQGGAVNNLLDILSLTVYLGIAVISTGLVLNWINLVAKRDWRTLLFDKAGVLGGAMYGTGVLIAVRFARSGFRELGGSNVPILVIASCALLMFARFPVEHVAARREGRTPHVGPGMWLMEWIIELLEAFSGYLANTLSFMRVAGLGIAHVMLMVAFYQIARMITPVGWSVPAVLVLVAGNALVIALEGLSAGIQSLRLNYYEFFSKYFTPTGAKYRPIAMTTQQ
jgi:V/A-type H+-transporting ATPase subunit I